jgi:hypothetical protein
VNDKLALVHQYRSQFAALPTTTERFSPGVRGHAKRSHEGLWEFEPGEIGAGVRRPMVSRARPRPERADRPGLRPFAALLSHGPGTERPLYLSLTPALPPTSNPPLVSAIMVTADRPLQARVAIDCYRRQSWPNRHLTIADTGSDRSLEQWIATLRDPSIEYQRIRRGGLTLGEVRNLAASRSQGEFLCVWDDDDLYHPHRIAMQMSAIDEVDADACLLARVMVWWPSGGELAITQHRPWEGTLLCKRDAMPRYRALGRSEDTPAVAALLARARVIQIDAPDLYIYVRHASNVSGDEHFRSIVGNATLRKAGADYGAMLARLAPAYPIRGYLDAIRRQKTAPLPA